jgi:hypothetical protein
MFRTYLSRIISSKRPCKINFAGLAHLSWLAPIKAPCHILKYLMLRMLFIGDDEPCRDAIQTRFVKWLAQRGYYSQNCALGFWLEPVQRG